MAVIFISCGTVSGVRIVINNLCDCIECGYVSRETLIKEVSRYGEWATEALTQLSEATSAYEKFSRTRRPYTVLIRQALLEKIRDDNVIFHGFSSHLLVPRLKHFVRIRINAPLTMRIPMTMERLGYDEKTAREYIAKSDENQVKWARFVYGIDIRNPALYDLNINLNHLSTQAICSIIRNILAQDDLKATEELKSEVERALLAANVEAALIIDPRTRELEIDAVHADGEILLTGPYLEEARLAVVRDIAQTVDGVEQIEYSPGFVSPHRFEEYEGISISVR